MYGRRIHTRKAGRKWRYESEEPRSENQIGVVIVLILICAAILVHGAIPKEQKPVNYTIYIYQNGAAEIEVDNIARVIQTESKLTLYTYIYFILPGNGNPIYYNYERHDNVTQERRGLMEKFKKWIKKAGMRAVRTIAQSAIATIGAAAVFAEVDWKMVVSAALLGRGTVHAK